MRLFGCHSVCVCVYVVVGEREKAACTVYFCVYYCVFMFACSLHGPYVRTVCLYNVCVCVCVFVSVCVRVCVALAGTVVSEP